MSDIFDPLSFIINITSFLAPERRWPWPDRFPKEIDPEELANRLTSGEYQGDYSNGVEFKSPQVDEKSDIWKLPDLIEKIIYSGLPTDAITTKRMKAMITHLKPIMKDCKNKVRVSFLLKI